MHRHAEGDSLWRLIAESTRINMRRTDAVGRLGGDEFALLMLETGEDAAMNIIGKIGALRDIAQKSELMITMSIGMIVYLSPPENVEEMIRKSDTLVYSVKASGKNNIRHAVVGRPEVITGEL